MFSYIELTLFSTQSEIVDFILLQIRDFELTLYTDNIIQ